MPLLISDEMLSQTGLSERQAKIEIACRLYAASQLSMPSATQWTGLSRVEFEQELLARDLPLVRVDDEYWRGELQSLGRGEEQ
jgi:predicted HTH domain antitoxin